MLIFKLYGADPNGQIALRPAMINRVVTQPGDEGEDFAMIFVREGKDGEQGYVVQHSVKEVVTAIMKVADYF